MKSITRTLISFSILVGLLLVSVPTPTHAQVGPPGTQSLPTNKPLEQISSPPPQGLKSAVGWSWDDGAIQRSTIVNCVSIIYPPWIYEYGAGVYVGYYANPGAGLPTPNNVYYVHVVLYGLGNACSGMYAYVDIGLPPNTALAISSTNPVYCYADGVLSTGCPQTLPPSTYNAGWFEVPSTASNHTWPLPQGHNWEFQIPVYSTTTLANQNFQSAIWMLDGNSSPWLVPSVPIDVYAPPTPGAFNKSSPSSGTTGLSTSPTLSWGASSGAASYSYCYDTSNDNVCSSWLNNGSATSKALSGLAANTTYFWHVRAANSGGTTYSNGSSSAFWSFHTASLPPPGTFSKASPGNGALNLPANPTLKWSTSANATSYQYCIDLINDNLCSTGWKSVGTNTGIALTGLAPAKYYWQVHSKNSAGTTDANGGTWWSFTVPPKPGIFGKTSPTNGAIGRPVNLTLKWGVSSNSVKYEYCIDTINNGVCDTSWISRGLNTSVSLTGLTKNAKYFWQVRARNVKGATLANGGSWWNFTTLP